MMICHFANKLYNFHLCFLQFFNKYDIFSFQYNTPTYEPQKYAMNANVLRQPMGMTPSERKKFADAERKRLSELTRTRPGLPNPR